ncbi:MAG: hypothetical protein LIO77_10045 [Rikenellaceae bacterium]|nr:hypothetical protein [Rikenellaceae bacterium]
MNTGKYIIRSLRYILRMVVLLGIVFAVMAAAGLLETTHGNAFHTIFLSRNGMVLAGILVILAGIYPKVSFTQVRIEGDIHADRPRIKEVMQAYGFVTARESEDTMTFHSSKLSRRIASQFDDTVTVTGSGGVIWLEGMKRDIYRLEARLRSVLDNSGE